MKKILIYLLLVFGFLLKINSVTKASEVTLTNCYFYKYDNSEFTGAWKDIWAP